MQLLLRERGVKPLYVGPARLNHYVPVDRCSREWALRRARRIGHAKGLAQPLQGEALWFGAPRWQWRMYVSALLEWCTSRIASSPADRFRGSYRLARAAGQLRGMREQGRWGHKGARRP